MSDAFRSWEDLGVMKPRRLLSGEGRMCWVNSMRPWALGAAVLCETR